MCEEEKEMAKMDSLAEVTVQRLANQVKVFQIDSRREIVVILVDRGRTDTGGTR